MMRPSFLLISLRQALVYGTSFEKAYSDISDKLDIQISETKAKASSLRVQLNMFVDIPFCGNGEVVIDTTVMLANMLAQNVGTI